MDLLAVREGIANNLRQITGLRVFSYVPETIEPPAAVVGYPTAWAYHKAFLNGLDGAEDIEVHILLGNAVDNSSQELLSQYVMAEGATSIRAAIESDTTLGGACQTSVVSHVDSFGSYTVASTEYLGCKFHVRTYG